MFLPNRELLVSLNASQVWLLRAVLVPSPTVLDQPPTSRTCLLPRCSHMFLAALLNGTDFLAQIPGQKGHKHGPASSFAEAPHTAPPGVSEAEDSRVSEMLSGDPRGPGFLRHVHTHAGGGVVEHRHRPAAEGVSHCAWTGASTATELLASGQVNPQQRLHHQSLRAADCM